MLKLGVTLGRESTEKAAIEKRTCTAINYVSNFSRSTDGWSEEQGIATFTPAVTVGGLFPVLQLDFEAPRPGATGGATILKILDKALSAGCSYSYSLQYYIPAGNVNITSLKNISIGGKVLTIDNSPVPTGTWLTRSGNFIADADNVVKLQFNTLDAAGADSAYLYDIRIFSNF